MNTSIIPQATHFYLNALTTTSPNKITLTLTSTSLSASLINNTLDISKVKTVQMDSTNTLSTLVKRDSSTGGFVAGQAQLMYAGVWLHVCV